MARIYNNLEEYIHKLLDRIGIHHPHQLNIEQISQRLGMSIYYLPFGSAYIDGRIFLDSRNQDAEQWQDFGHELCHALWHAGDQALIPLTMLEYQEWKAANFAQNLCIPSFMLDNMNLPDYDKEAIWLLQETFLVERSFAEKRLDQYCRNLRVS